MANLTRAAKNYQAVASQLDTAQLLSKYDFINIKKGAGGAVQITAADAAISSGASTNGSQPTTTAIKAGNVGFFSTPNTGVGGTVSVRQNTQGTQYFSTNDANTSTTVTTGSKGGSGTIGVKTTSTNSNQSLANKLSNFSTTQWVVLGGFAAAAVLAYTLLKR